MSAYLCELSPTANIYLDQSLPLVPVSCEMKSDIFVGAQKKICFCEHREKYIIILVESRIWMFV